MSTVQAPIFRGGAFLRPLVFSRPLRLVEPTSWAGHIPFAFWLVDRLRPRTIVELGTQSGNSYSAMAQAVLQLELDTSCYAVDTWAGDPHTGWYGEEVFAEWSAFHDQHFGTFSRLVRSTFDDALPNFPDGSIDLLHIDGFHTYEAVRHDFQSWQPKLSTRAVVILHDINVREREFGVWKFWEGLSSEYPSFAFLHGHGLGVVGCGTELPDDLRELFRLAEANDTFVVRQFFGTLGEALVAQSRLTAGAKRESDLRAETSRVQAEAAALAGELERVRAEAAAAAAAREAAASELATTTAELARVRSELAAGQSELGAIQDAVDSALRAMTDDAAASAAPGASSSVPVQSRFDGQFAAIRLGTSQARQRIKQLGDECTRQAGALRKAEEDLGRYIGLGLGARRSRAWRMTAALRQAAAVGRDAARRTGLRRGAGPAHALPLLAPLRRSVRAQTRMIQASGLFDPVFYLRDLSRQGSDADLAAAWDDPLLHYLLVGGFRGANPHPLFDSAFYLQRNGDVAAAGINPLVHYLQSGWQEKRDPHPLFDTAFYLKQYPDVAAAKINPLVHFVAWGAHDARAPNPWFDSAFYLEADPTLRQTSENPLVHYLRTGASEGRPTGPLFDTGFYAASNPDVVEAGVNPLAHFITTGQHEGRRSTAGLPLPTAGDTEASSAAYDRVRTRFRETERARVQNLAVAPPALIEVAEQTLAQRARDVRLPLEASPLVSIVIPIVNSIKLTLECLLSIVSFTTDVPYEVVIVDNGSTDRSQELLSSIPHLVYVRHESNQGFGPACNAGAAVARGRYLVFLNNDAQAQQGWLSTLLAAFQRNERVGAVGPKVLFPDGRLQDAGSLINPDCTSSLLGVFDDPGLPRYNCEREVDYVSGVCLVMETERFRALAGFDEGFAPAYCEDVDLCLRLRREGLRVLYQPQATIVHHLSATSKELGPSFKMTAVVRHQQELSSRHQEQIDALDRTRILAFYLPQFHPIAENDVWWGKGFTEWRNVTRARPAFAGHYQPRLPGDLGFYDLRLRETYVDQVTLARRYGIDGFCFYYYWFSGRRLLERPLERLIEDPALDFPFSICWANENWTRRWDGLEHEILMAQGYRDEDDVAVIADLHRYFQHPSYIRVNGRPLLLVYHASRFPDIRRTIDRWRSECQRTGIGDIYLAMVETFELRLSGASPVEWGFDATVEFPPHQGGAHPLTVKPADTDWKGHVFGYDQTAVHYMTRPLPNHRLFRTVMPGWDNSARRPKDAVVFADSTPGGYQAWLECMLRQTREQQSGDEQLLFVNAWNEWAEAAYLEPDLAWGHAYLEATRDARINARLRLRSE